MSSETAAGDILQKMLMKSRSYHGKPGLHKEYNMAAMKTHMGQLMKT